MNDFIIITYEWCSWADAINVYENLELKVKEWLKNNPWIEVVSMSYFQIVTNHNDPYSASVAIMYKTATEPSA